MTFMLDPDFYRRVSNILLPKVYCLLPTAYCLLFIIY